MSHGMRSCLAMTLGAGLVLAAVARGVEIPELTPYTADDTTLHLWHLDEKAPPFMDSGSSPTPLWGLLNGARAGAPALARFGSAVEFVYDPANEPGVERPYGPIQRLCSESFKALVMNILNQNAGQHQSDFFCWPGEALPNPTIGMAIPPKFVV